MADDNKSTTSDLIASIGGFISNLTPKSLVLGALGGFIGLCLYSLYEQRLVAFPYIVNSPGILWALGILACVLILVYATVVSVKRVEEIFELRISEQQNRINEQQKLIEDLRSDLDTCQKDCREANTGMLKEILEKLHGT